MGTDDLRLASTVSTSPAMATMLPRHTMYLRCTRTKSRAGRQAKAFDCPAAVTFPKSVSWMIVEIRGGVICRGSLVFGVF